MRKHTIPVTAGLFLLFSCTTARQSRHPIINGYAYVQETLAGTAPQHGADEQGKITTLSYPPRVSYFIYLETRRGIKPEITRVWVRRKTWNALLRPVSRTPVIILPDPMIPKDTVMLVPSTRNAVWLLDLKPADSMAEKKAPIPNQEMDENEVVIEYTWKGSQYYQGIPQIKRLPAIALQ